MATPESIFRLDGKVALVTGASSGLGARFARVLSMGGAKVGLAARRLDRLKALRDEIAAIGCDALPVSLDVSDPNAIKAAADIVESQLGPIDILVNNSGISVQRRLGDYSPADYDQVMNTNLRGAFFVAQEIGKRMVSRRTGHIINIASVAGLRAINQLAVYGMSKAALVQMTKSMALEWGRHGVNVNALCPGYIETEINSDYWTSEGGQKLLSILPRKRIGQPQDLDGALLMLASGASGFINGAVISADDGFSIA